LVLQVTGAFENVFMSQNAWFMYAATMRIFKHYHFNVIDEATAATSMSFSSYAGSVVSCQHILIGVWRRLNVGYHGDTWL